MGLGLTWVIQEAIEQGAEQEAKDMRGAVHASQISHPCLRFLCLNVWAKERGWEYRFSPGSLAPQGALRLGIAFEEYAGELVQKRLEALGYRVERGVKVSYAFGVLLEGEVDLYYSRGAERGIVEFKYTNARKMSRIKKGELEVIKNWLVQVQAYLLMTGAEVGYLVVGSPHYAGGEQLVVLEVLPDPAILDWIEERLGQIEEHLRANSLPPMGCEDPDLCPLGHICLELLAKGQ